MDAEEIGRYNPQRFEFLQLTSILHWDREKGVMVAHRAVREDEFWVRGHIPGRPLLPGVLMVEAMAQLASVLCRRQWALEHATFFGLYGVDKARFRRSVAPPADLWVASRILRGGAGSSRFQCEGQILDAAGRLVATAVVHGIRM